MPPTLDLSRITTHKMIVAPPRFSLRRTVSYTHERDRDRDRGPLSSTSSRFGFEHLVFASPPPSPGLPQLLPPPARRRRRGLGRARLPASTPRPRRIVRVLLYAAGLVLVVYAALRAVRWAWGGMYSGSPRAVADDDDGFRYHWPATPAALHSTHHHHHHRTTAYEMVGANSLPDDPTPVLVRDDSRHGGGQARWTVSIPPDHAFPLGADAYADLCNKCAVVAERAETLRGGGKSNWLWSWRDTRNTRNTAARKVSHAAANPDRNFVDVHEAEVAGFLSGSVSITTLLQQQQRGQLVGEGDSAASSSSSSFGRPVCGRSLTFVLASADAGLGRTLMLLWMAYAQAQAEGRGFFVDDTRWQYGRYTDLFVPPPSPGCRPPLRHEMLPCPRAARHLVVTLETAGFFFGVEEAEEAEEADEPTVETAETETVAPPPPPTEADRNARLFALARRGYEALFRLTDEDARHVAGRVKQLRAKAGSAAAGSDSDSTIVGVHVRRGDRRPVEFQYRDSYVPLSVYADQAHAEMAVRQKKKSSSSGGGGSGGLLVLASDDPTVYEADEVAGAARAQEHIRLAGAAGSGGAAASTAQDADRGAFHKFVDETFGWEGGFFASMFWNLGGGLPSAAETATPDTLRIRSLVGRAYVLDLAVLARASDAVVCAVSATGCRLLAVMLGREAALAQGRWVNVDGADGGWWAVDF